MTKIDLSATVSYLSRDTHRYLFYSYFLYGLWLNFTQNLDQQKIIFHHCFFLTYHHVFLVIPVLVFSRLESQKPPPHKLLGYGVRKKTIPIIQNLKPLESSDNKLR